MFLYAHTKWFSSHLYTDKSELSRRVQRLLRTQTMSLVFLPAWFRASACKIMSLLWSCFCRISQNYPPHATFNFTKLQGSFVKPGRTVRRPKICRPVSVGPCCTRNISGELFLNKCSRFEFKHIFSPHLSFYDHLQPLKSIICCLLFLSHQTFCLSPLLRCEVKIFSRAFRSWGHLMAVFFFLLDTGRI